MCLKKNDTCHLPLFGAVYQYALVAAACAGWQILEKDIQPEKLQPPFHKQCGGRW
jgi:hypothetical protein